MPAISKKEAKLPKVRANIVNQLIKKEMTAKQAGLYLYLSERHIGRLRKKYLDYGLPGLLSKHFGKKAANKIPDDVRLPLLATVKEKYHDFGPTFAHEKLTEHHGATICNETLRKWMIDADMWKPHMKPTERKQHLLRDRRSCVGELAQVDGSIHDWFEGRAPKCTLLTVIDDATSRILCMRFFPVENCENYLKLFKVYLSEIGVPVSIYVDKHSVFKVNQPGSEKSITQFARAMTELNIEVIYAQSSQAKGRVERCNRTNQDRLVKEMRLLGISTIDAANEYVASKYTEIHNQKFAVAPANSEDKHTQLQLSQEELDLILCYKHERVVRKNLSLSYENQRLQLKTLSPMQFLIGEKIEVCKLLSGELILRYQGEVLNYISEQTERQQRPEADSKTLNFILDKISAERKKPLAPSILPMQTWKQQMELFATS